MPDRVYDDERAMNIIASALMDSLDPEEFIEHVREVVEMTGRDPDKPYEADRGSDGEQRNAASTSRSKRRYWTRLQTRLPKA